MCSFLDVYFEEDLRKGCITEQQVQELVDQFVMKMRIVRCVGTCVSSFVCGFVCIVVQLFAGCIHRLHPQCCCWMSYVCLCATGGAYASAQHFAAAVVAAAL